MTVWDTRGTDAAAGARAVLLVSSAVLFCFYPSIALGQEQPVRFRESVAIETSLIAQRQIELARVHLADKRWNEGIDLLRQVTENEPASLVSIEPGRYINVNLYAQLLLANLPPEGLAVARKSIDVSARQVYDEAVLRRDEVSLRGLVRGSFVSRATDDALLTLGQWSWELGDVAQARGWWERLFPLRSPPPAGSPASILRYPDTHRDPASVLARVVMCGVVEGDAERAAIERDFFRRHYPQARGELGRKEGRLCDRLDQIASQAAAWKIPPRDSSVATFGVNAARNGVLPREIEVGALRWTVDLPPDPYRPTADERSRNDQDALDLYPVVFGDILLVNTADQILAWNLHTGKPAWPSGQGDEAAIYPAVADTSSLLSPTRLVGAPRYTMSVNEGRLFARMGSPVTTHPSEVLRESDSHIVCLDLAHGEGKLIWKSDASAIDALAAFEGSPLVVDGRAYASVRRGRPQMQTDVVCFDAESGRRLWDRPICAAVAAVGQSESLMSHQLLAAGDDAVFLSTGSGAIGAVEADTGALRWVVTYESEGQEIALAQRVNVTSPCLFSQNRVFAAPNDFDGILAVDSRSGLMLWQRSLPGGIEHLLGAKNGVLVAGGRSLWGLEESTGRVIWHVGFTDPASFGYGRGILAGDVVYWPTREEIFVADQSTGELRRRIPLLARSVESGGNLTLAEDLLVVAQPQRLAVFGPDAGFPLKRTELYSAAERGRGNNERSTKHE